MVKTMPNASGDLSSSYEEFVTNTAGQFWVMLQSKKPNKPITLLSQQAPELQETMRNIVELIVNLYTDFAGKEGWEMKPIDLTYEMKTTLHIQATKFYEKMYLSSLDFGKLCGQESGQLNDFIVAATGIGKPGTDKYTSDHPDLPDLEVAQ